MGGRNYTPVDVSTYRGQWGDNFRRLRMARFETQTEFAEALATVGIHVKKAAVSHWELGRRTPPIEFLPLIARVLKCDVIDLVPRLR